MVKNAQYGTWLNESHTQFHQATSIAIECGKVLSLSGTHTQIITLEMEDNYERGKEGGYSEVKKLAEHKQVC